MELSTVVLISFVVFFICQFLFGMSLSELQLEMIRDEDSELAEDSLSSFQRRLISISALSLITLLISGTVMVGMMIYKWVV